MEAFSFFTTNGTIRTIDLFGIYIADYIEVFALMLNFLNLITVPWSRRRISLFLGYIQKNIKGLRSINM